MLAHIKNFPTVMTTDSPLGRVALELKDGKVDLKKLRVQQTWWVASVSMTQELRGIEDKEENKRRT